MRLLLSLAPLIAFYVVESSWGLRPAVVVGLVLAAVEVGWTRWSEGRWSRMTLFTAGLVGILGGLSLASDDERFVLWTPVVGDVLVALLVAGAQVRGVNVVVAALAEQEPDLDLHPLQSRAFDGLAWRFVALMLLHAALTAWSTTESRETWLFVSGPVQYLLLGGLVAFEAVWARVVVWPAVDAAEAAEAGDDASTS